MIIETIEPFLDHFERVRARTLRVIKCIPPEKLDWTYKEGKFTLGDLVRHVAAAERYMFAENVQFKPSRYPGHLKELADGYTSVLEFLNTAHAEAVAIFRGLSDEDLQKKCTTPGRNSDHGLEMAAGDDRARDSSSRANLSLPRDA
jgi:uncharacterized damage-inducible protein DinB